MSSLLQVMTRRARPLTTLRGEDRVVLFPSLGQLSRDGQHWIANIHGDVSSAAARPTLGKRLLLKLLQRSMRASDEAFSSDLFRERIARFAAQDRPGRRIAVRVGEKIVALPKRTRADGHFQAALRVPVGIAQKLADRAADETLLPLDVCHPDHSVAASGQVRLIRPTGVSIISDIDDTLKHSFVACKRTLLANTFLKPFEAIPGMAALFQEWSAAGAAIHYVSSSPWQLYPHLAEHLSGEGFPAGSFHLRAFRLRDHLLRRLLMMRRSGKLSVIRALVKSFPGRQFILVGDSGEHDPEVYGAVARRYRDQVAGLFIRRLGGPGESARRYAKSLRGIDPTLVRLYEHADELADVRLPTL